MKVYTLSPEEVRGLLELVSAADVVGLKLRVAVDDGLKVKLGGGVWTPPMGAPFVTDGDLS